MTAKKTTKPAKPSLPVGRKAGAKASAGKPKKAKPTPKAAKKVLKKVSKSVVKKAKPVKKLKNTMKKPLKKAPKKISKTKPALKKKVVAKKSAPKKPAVPKKVKKTPLAKAKPAPKAKAPKKSKEKSAPKVSKRDVMITPVIHSARVEKPTLGALYVRSGRHFFTEDRSIVDMPELISAQLDSYASFIDFGLQEALESVFPISDFSEERVEIHFK